MVRRHTYIGDAIWITLTGDTMPKPMRIPKPLREAIISKLKSESRTLSASDIATNVNDQVKPQHRRNSRQMPFVLKQMERDGEVESVVISKNGFNHHGNARDRVEWIIVGGNDSDKVDEKP